MPTPAAHHHHGGHSHAAEFLGEGAASHWTGRLQWALVANLGLVVAELVGGLAVHSMAVVSDGVHNLTDVPTLAISWLAVRWATRPPTSEKTYGYHRAGILAAFTNALVLIFVGLYIVWVSYVRLRHPVAVHAGPMMALGALALLVNGGTTLALVRGRRDLNVRAIVVHNLGDAFSNVAILAGAVIIHFTGIFWIDPLIGLAIGVMVIWTTIGILRESSHILLEGSPKQMRLEEIADAILTLPPVQEIHDIHVWTLGTDQHILSCHVRIPDMHMEESEKLLQSINERLAERFDIHHATIQFERAGPVGQNGLYMPRPLDSASR
jgi:cobalt-zinc-cadmium efflux system protein